MRGRRVVFPEQGRVAVEEFEVPAIGEHQVLVRTEVSLVSAGTELTTLLGGHEGQRYPAVPGYSNVGIVEEVGPAVVACRPGDRVVSEGRHASYCLIDLEAQAARNPDYLERVPDGVSPEEAAFAVLGSVAMHGVRKAEPRLHQSAAVIGQGVVGQLIAQLVRIAGCSPVVGIDVIPMRLEKARQSGTPVVVNSRERELHSAVSEVTQGAGVDLGFDATRSTRTLPALMGIAALSGKVIVVGSIPGTAEDLALQSVANQGVDDYRRVAASVTSVMGHAYFPWT